MSRNPLQLTALMALERLINAALDLDPATRQRLEELNGQRFKLDCRQPQILVVLDIRENGLGLSLQDSELFTTAISGSFAEFSKIALADDPAGALINGDVQVSGDTAPLLELRAILAELDIDWELPLSRLVGDVAAHQIGRQLRAAQRFAGQALRHFRRQFSEFVVEESDLMPHPVEVEDFYRELEELSARTERLQARFQQLRQRMSGESS